MVNLCAGMELLQEWIMELTANFAVRFVNFRMRLLQEWIMEMAVNFSANLVVALYRTYFVCDLLQEWSMELTAVLRELGCPHRGLVEGPIGERLASPKARLILLDFLLTELMAAKMMAASSNSNSNNKGSAMNIKIQVN
jgi:hypothetical protein